MDFKVGDKVLISGMRTVHHGLTGEVMGQDKRIYYVQIGKSLWRIQGRYLRGIDEIKKESVSSPSSSKALPKNPQVVRDGQEKETGRV